MRDALTADLRSLERREDANDCAIYETVLAHIAPLPVLRDVVASWMAALPPHSPLYDAAETFSLILHPECVADSARPSPGRKAPLLPEVPVWHPLPTLPRVLLKRHTSNFPTSGASSPNLPLPAFRPYNGEAGWGYGALAPQHCQYPW